MTRTFLAAACALSLAAAPLPAQEAEDERGFGLMERGAELFFRGILEEMGPAMRDFRNFAEGVEPAMRDFLAEMGPALKGILEEVEDWSVYHPPEMLPNGDIIMRRKEKLDPEEAPEGEVDI
ncbi:hypothetical protein OCH239_02095 [Roseivivax halodurans JCM 10272]|uniref:AAA+ family ATPase n=1 Tax=Roseivivax halodurans JCM 10272 TaxID=1449350 RepID=X7EN94_9RHOB|nr:hypothetical protein [Roseivivax halodurans]ETX16638.1 hypothetical protein OCH239_02095 [Roseivivax halodurans JCM 10272]